MRRMSKAAKQRNFERGIEANLLNAKGLLKEGKTEEDPTRRLLLAYCTIRSIGKAEQYLNSWEKIR